MRLEQLGPYRLLRKLGRGGMGTVFEGVNVETGEPAAVKMLAFSLSGEKDFRARFENEIETLKKLRHPNIVRLLGFGEQDTVLFYVMELVPGRSLEDEIRNGRIFDWREVADIAIQVCQALRHAHDRGVIHRDIKPANLLLSPEGVVKLSDFGIARLFGSAQRTAAGSVLGTVEYMSPEQADGELVGPKADLYSLGGVLYALLAGRPPFRARSFAEMLEKHRHETPEPVCRFAPDTPAELERIVAQLLAKEPDQRVRNALILSRRLQAMQHALSPDRQHGQEDSDAESQEIDTADGPLTFGVPGETGGKAGRARPGGMTLTHHGSEDAASGEFDEPTQETSYLQRLAAQGKVAAAQETEIRGPASPGSQSEQAEPVEAESELVITAPDSKRVPAGDAAEVERDADQPAARLGSAAVDSAADEAVPSGEESVGAEESGNGEPLREDQAVGEKPDAEATQRASGRFVLVSEEDLDRPLERTPPPIVSLRIVMIGAGLLALGFFLWYMLQPVTADTLHRRIEEKVSDGSAGSLLTAEPQIEQFLARFPGDPRCEKLREYADEIDLIQLERRLEFRLRHQMTDQSMIPIERDYLEALHYVDENPELAIQKLEALIDLYESPGARRRGVTAGETGDDDGYRSLGGPRDQCLELARRRLANLRRELAPVIQLHREMIQSRLALADEIEAEHPEDARRIRQAVLTLYAEKDWAADLLAEARSHLAAEQATPQ